MTVSDENSDTDSDIDDTDDATVMGSSVAYAEVEASIRALRYGSVEGNQGEYCVFEEIDGRVGMCVSAFRSVYVFGCVWVC